VADAHTEGPPRDARRAADLLFRRRAGQLTATLTRVLGIEHLDLVEDVVQDAFVQAMRRWPGSGVPDNPGAWILRVAKNRAIDILRRQGRWREKRDELERSILPEDIRPGGPPVFFSDAIEDDELRLIFATCHPALSRDAQVALTLKTAGGFGTAEIARAFLTSKATVAQRIVRAKRALREGQVPLEIPSADDMPARLDAALEVLYLMFSEGYEATSGDALVRAELCGEAIRLAEMLAAHPRVGGPAVHALVALFLFQAARLPTRTDRGGDLLPLDRQDRAGWDRRLIRRALEHQRRSAAGSELSPYHLQSEIASCHTLAPTFEDTDWPRILRCYDALMDLAPSPVVALNRAVAVAHAHGPDAGLAALESIPHDPALADYPPRWAVEGELLARAGRLDAAERALVSAVNVARSEPVRRHLSDRLDELRQSMSTRS
jgi:RNA polymerase sigma-70 factor (ECF subfamily)